MQSQSAGRTTGVPANGCGIVEQKGTGSRSAADKGAFGSDDGLPWRRPGEIVRAESVRLTTASAVVSYAFPPRLMRVEAAAYYVGLSVTCFLDRVKAGDYPPGIKDRGIRAWLRDDLDASIERRFGVSDASRGYVGIREDPFAARFSKAR